MEKLNNYIELKYMIYSLFKEYIEGKNIDVAAYNTMMSLYKDCGGRDADLKYYNNLFLLYSKDKCIDLLINPNKVITIDSIEKEISLLNRIFDK